LGAVFVGLVIAPIAFFFALPLTLIPLVIMSNLASRLDFYGLFVGLHMILVIGFSLLVGKWSYGVIRWRWVSPDEPVCDSCQYDLTGNVSGICPECGAPVLQGLSKPPDHAPR